jgi:hypothetical protein
MITFKLVFAYILSPYVQEAKNGYAGRAAFKFTVQGCTENQWPMEELRR